jgi:perosamine synthetase
MRRIDEVIADRQRLGRLYRDALAGTGIVVAPEEPWAETVYWLYSVLLPAGVSRDRVMLLLAGEGIETRPFFYPLHEMPPYRAEPSRFPVATDLARRGLTLPSFYEMSQADVVAVVEALGDATTRA